MPYSLLKMYFFALVVCVWVVFCAYGLQPLLTMCSRTIVTFLLTQEMYLICIMILFTILCSMGLCPMHCELSVVILLLFMAVLIYLVNHILIMMLDNIFCSHNICIVKVCYQLIYYTAHKIFDIIIPL